MAKPAPMAESAGIHTEPSSANAACGVTKVAAVKAAAVPVLAVGADTWELRGAATKAVRNAPQDSRTAAVSTNERAILVIWMQKRKTPTRDAEWLAGKKAVAPQVLPAPGVNCIPLSGSVTKRKSCMRHDLRSHGWRVRGSCYNCYTSLFLWDLVCRMLCSPALRVPPRCCRSLWHITDLKSSSFIRAAILSK